MSVRGSEPSTIYEEILNELLDFLCENGLDVFRTGYGPGCHLRTDGSWMLTVQSDGIRIYWSLDVLILPFEDPEQFEKVLKKLRTFEKTDETSTETA